MVEAGQCGVPRRSRFAWISTRGAETVVDAFSENLIAKHTLARIIHDGAVSLQEFSTASVVMIEAPAVAKARYELAMFEMIQKLKSQGSEVIVLVQPSLRRKSNRTLWVQRWNQMKQTPFKFSSNVFMQDRG